MRAALFALLIFATPAWATPPETSLRPVARPGSTETGASPRAAGPSLAAAINATLSGLSAPSTAPAPKVGHQVRANGRAVARSLRPAARPDRVVRAGAARQKALRAGSVCGLPGVQGTRVGRVPGKIRGCGVGDAVRVTSVSGVALSTGAVMDCGTAKALQTWVDRGLKPAVGSWGGGVSSLRVAAHYVCRTRNHKKGARISEHGKGRAIDISAISLKSGRSITVLRDWNNGRDGAILRQVHKAACGPFGTVLGPNSDRYHRDHFHFDTARYRGGPYCR